MSADTALSRVNTVDFFGVLVPGVYVAANLSLLGFAFVDPNITTDPAWSIINNAVVNVELNKLLLLLLISYLLGSTARALPVNTVDRVSGWVNSTIIPRKKARRQAYAENFPYLNLLEGIFTDLNKNNSFTISNRPKAEPTPMAAFNYWKAVIAKESPNLVAQIRAAEARVRMFAGIVWATAFSLAVCLIALLCPRGQSWWQPFVFSACCSFTLLLVFVTLIRSMRREEARAVYVGFLAIHRA
jgi:hypothetical protein